jgi:hypothetical protein
MQAPENNYGPNKLPGRAYRESIVRKAINVTRDTPAQPSAYEKKLLAKFIEGAMTIEDIIELLKEKT